MPDFSDIPNETYAYDRSGDSEAITALVEEHLDAFSANCSTVGANQAIAAALEFGKYIEDHFIAKMS